MKLILMLQINSTMKLIFNLAFIGLTLLSHQNLFAQSIIEWQKTLGGSGCDVAQAIQQTTDQGFVVAGVYGKSNSNGDIWVIKLSSNGEIEWEKKIGGSDFDSARSVHQTSDQGYIVAGYTDSSNGDVGSNNGGRDFWIVKLSSDGNIEWEKTYGGSNTEDAISIKQTSDNGYIAVGYTRSDDGDVSEHKGNNDFWIIKLSIDGDLEWEKTYGGSLSEYARSVQQTPDGGFIVAGSTYSDDDDVAINFGFFDFWIIKLSQDGDLEWEKTYGGTKNEEAFSIQVTSDDGYIVAGYTDSDDGDVEKNMGKMDLWVIKLFQNGDLEWEKSYGGSEKDYALSIQETTDEGFIIAGYTSSDDGDVGSLIGIGDFWIVKLSQNGNLELEKTFGGSSYDEALSIQQTLDGGLIVAGKTLSDDGDVDSFNGGKDFWILKLSSTIVGLNELENDPENLIISPNPSNGEFTILLQNISDVKLIEIINVVGSTVHSSNNIQQINYISEIPKGVYWVKISSESKYSLQQIIIH